VIGVGAGNAGGKEGSTEGERRRFGVYGSVRAKTMACHYSSLVDLSLNYDRSRAAFLGMTRLRSPPIP
jgi:hypothetical protein